LLSRAQHAIQWRCVNGEGRLDLFHTPFTPFIIRMYKYKQVVTKHGAHCRLSVSDAVRILLKRVVNDQAFPLELKVPKEKLAAMEEARMMMKSRTGTHADLFEE